jgi:hypothetical protein
VTIRNGTITYADGVMLRDASDNRIVNVDVGSATVAASIERGSRSRVLESDVPGRAGASTSTIQPPACRATWPTTTATSVSRRCPACAEPGNRAAGNGNPAQCLNVACGG